MNISPLLIVNLLLCTALHISYEHLLTPPGEVAPQLMVEEIVRELDVVAEFPLVDEVLNLILELVAVVSVMPYVTMITTILTLVPVCSLFPYREWPSKMYPSFTGLKYLGSIGV